MGSIARESSSGIVTRRGTGDEAACARAGTSCCGSAACVAPSDGKSSVLAIMPALNAPALAFHAGGSDAAL